MALKKIQMQDEYGDVYYPRTCADNVMLNNGINVESTILQLDNVYQYDLSFAGAQSGAWIKLFTLPSLRNIERFYMQYASVLITNMSSMFLEMGSNIADSRNGSRIVSGTATVVGVNIQQNILIDNMDFKVAYSSNLYGSIINVWLKCPENEANVSVLRLGKSMHNDVNFCSDISEYPDEPEPVTYLT